MTHSAFNPTQAADVAAIHAVLVDLVACWNRGDGTAYGTLFTTDADYIDVTGTHTQGGSAIGSLHQFLFDGPLRGSQLEAGNWVQQPVHFLAPTVALVIGGGTSRLEGQPSPPDDRQSINTMILVKQDDGWLIRAFQNNRIQAQPFGPPPGTHSPATPHHAGGPDEQP